MIIGYDHWRIDDHLCVYIYISPNMSELHKFRSMKIWKPGGLALWEAPTNISTNSQRHDVSPWVEATALLSNIIRPVISCIYVFIYLIMYVYTYSNIHNIYIYSISIYCKRLPKFVQNWWKWRATDVCLSRFEALLLRIRCQSLGLHYRLGV